MTRALPMPPRIALEAALHRLGDKSRYEVFVAAKTGAADDPNVSINIRGGVRTRRRDEARVASELLPWARGVFAAFAPTPLIRVAAGFEPAVGKPKAAQKAPAGEVRPPLFSLARFVKSNWSALSFGTPQIDLDLELARYVDTGELVRDLRVRNDVAGRVKLGHDASEPLWLAAFDQWLQGVSMLELSFNWSEPSAHLIASLARNEARP